MDVKDMLKFHFVSGLAQGGNNMNHAGGSSGGKSTFDQIISMACQAVFMLLIGFADELAKQIPGVINAIRDQIKSKISSSNLTQSLETLRQTPIQDHAVLLDKRHFTNSVTMSRVYPENDKDKAAVDRLEEMNGMIDAILKVVTKQHNVPSFRLIETAQLMLNYKDNPIQLNEDIFIKVDGINASAEGFIGRIDITLMSNNLSASDISKYIKHVYDLHKEELRNALGDTIYYFDQKAKDGGMGSDPRTKSMRPEDLLMHKQMKIQSAPKSLAFTKAPFISNKSFDNIFGDGVRSIEKRLSFFLKNKAWYDNRGIPYQLGLMMSGAPGTGKTSIIRAIANLTKRHIINVNFGNIQSATQLKNLFQAEKLSVYTDSSYSDMNSFHIPIDQRIYVLEEIDTVGDIVKQRVHDSDPHQSLHDEVTLGEILTVLDGTMETPGRIVIMTSNHPELLDEALIRPGRIDVMVKFEKASQQTISEMFQAFYDMRMTEDAIQNLPQKMLTPAEVGQVLFQHFDDDKEHIISKIIDDLNETASANQNHQIQRQEAQRAEAERSIKSRRKSKSKKSGKSKKSRRASKLVEIERDVTSSEESISSYTSTDDEEIQISSKEKISDTTLPNYKTMHDEFEQRTQDRMQFIPGQQQGMHSNGISSPSPMPFNGGPSSLDDMFASMSDGIKVR